MFEIGERVTSAWTGPGTVVGPMERDEDRIPYQKVKFDNSLLGEKNHPIRKMAPYEDPPVKQPRNKIQKEGSDGSKAQSTQND